METINETKPKADITKLKIQLLNKLDETKIAVGPSAPPIIPIEAELCVK